jgi:hypothetical protein
VKPTVCVLQDPSYEGSSGRQVVAEFEKAQRSMPVNAVDKYNRFVEGPVVFSKYYSKSYKVGPLTKGVGSAHAQKQRAGSKSKCMLNKINMMDG